MAIKIDDAITISPLPDKIEPEVISQQETTTWFNGSMKWFIVLASILLLIGLIWLSYYCIHMWRKTHGYHWGNDVFSFNGTINSLDTTISSL